MKIWTLSILLLSALGVQAAPKDSVKMIDMHNYNISNSISGANNILNSRGLMNVVYMGDPKAICRHLGIVKGALDAVKWTIRYDDELKTTASFTDFEYRLGELRSFVMQTTSYCGDDKGGDGDFNPKLEGNNDFLVSQMKWILNAKENYDVEFTKVQNCVLGKGRCTKL